MQWRIQQTNDDRIAVHGAEETFLDTYRRLGAPPFKAALYEQKDRANAA